MSHVAKLILEVRDLPCLERAAKVLGLELAFEQKTYKWYGWSVGDYPIPKGMTAADLGKCDHAIRIPGDGRAYEVGVVKSKNHSGFELVWDFWQGGFGLRDKIGENGNKLRQEYAVQVAMKHARAQGYQVSRRYNAKGECVLTAVRS
jgi:hypothetical protein